MLRTLVQAMLFATSLLLVSCNAPSSVHEIAYGECLSEALEQGGEIEGEGSFLISRIGSPSITLQGIYCEEGLSGIPIAFTSDEARRNFLNADENPENSCENLIALQGRFAGQLRHLGDYQVLDVDELSPLVIASDRDLALHLGVTRSEEIDGPLHELIFDRCALSDAAS